MKAVSSNSKKRVRERRKEEEGRPGDLSAGVETLAGIMEQGRGRKGRCQMFRGWNTCMMQ
jgi:hypothetical protein